MGFWFGCLGRLGHFLCETTVCSEQEKLFGFGTEKHRETETGHTHDTTLQFLLLDEVAMYDFSALRCAPPSCLVMISDVENRTVVSKTGGRKYYGTVTSAVAH